MSEIYEIITPDGPREARISGKLRYESIYDAKKPAVGDWVLALPNEHGPYTVVGVIPRRTCLQRKAAGANRVEAQVIGANIDYCLVVQALDHDYNPSRLDRYIAAVEAAGIEPIIVLTKADTLPEAEMLEKASRLVGFFPRIPVRTISSVTGFGVQELLKLVVPEKTFVAIGSSGVGKSTLLNILSGQALMRTGAVRAQDQRGRHTTTHRELFRLPGGAIFIDTPGMREFGLFEYDGLGEAFADIAAIAAKCKFADCTHNKEPGCAVRDALHAGEVDEQRYESYLKLLNEERHNVKKQILLQKQLSNARKKRSGMHYKDHVRGVRRENEYV
jgi:ribosome biogenesis GTPase